MNQKEDKKISKPNENISNFREIIKPLVEIPKEKKSQPENTKQIIIKNIDNPVFQSAFDGDVIDNISKNSNYDQTINALIENCESSSINDSLYKKNINFESIEKKLNDMGKKKYEESPKIKTLKQIYEYDKFDNTKSNYNDKKKSVIPLKMETKKL